MKTVLSVLLIFATTIGFANEWKSLKNLRVQEELNDFGGITVAFGQKHLADPFAKNMSNRLNLAPYNTISIYTVGHIETSRLYEFPGLSLFTYNLPYQMTLSQGTDVRVQGFSYRNSVAGQYLIRRKRVNIFLTEGYDFGRLKIIDDKKQKLKNGYFAPFVGLVAGVAFHNFTILGIVQYELDISNKKWKSLWIPEPIPVNVKEYSHSGFHIDLGISYSLDWL
jgi:hypothetical protein